MAGINKLIWIDLEMTGLNPETDKIIEIATVITDSDLQIIQKGPEMAIFQEEDVLAGMNSWAQEQHQLSGLTERVRNSKISTKEAEQTTLDFLKQYVRKDTSPMCGNSVHQDRRFLNKYMPSLEAYFHYRNFDVSSFKIAASMWNPLVFDKIVKQDKHTAMADTLESIEELRLYKETLLQT